MPSTITLPDRPVALQGVPAPGYSAVDLRRLALTHLPQEGVVGAGDFKVTPGAGLTLAVAAGEAGVDGDSTAGQGRYYQRAAAATANLTLVTAPDGANPRIDQIVLEVKDDAHDASGLNEARIRVVAGTPTAGTTLDSRVGAAALPVSCVRLADLLVPAAFGGPFVATTHIRDRRPWAQGARTVVRRTAGNLVRPAAAAMNVLSTSIGPRVEYSGVPVVATLSALLEVGGTGDYGDFELWDGAARAAGVPKQTLTRTTSDRPDKATSLRWDVTPTPGSHEFRLAGSAPVGTWTLRADATYSLTWVVAEDTRALADNS